MRYGLEAVSVEITEAGDHYDPLTSPSGLQKQT